MPFRTDGWPVVAGPAAPISRACRSPSDRPPKTTPSTGVLYDGTLCLQSATLGSDTWRTHDAAIHEVRTLAHGRNEGIETPRAIDMLQGTADMPPRLRTVAGTAEGSSETPGVASAHATNGGFLNQADKQELTRNVSNNLGWHVMSAAGNSRSAHTRCRVVRRQ